MGFKHLFLNAAAQSTVPLAITAVQTSVTLTSASGFTAPTGSQQISVVILDSGNGAWNALNPFSTPYEYQSVNNVTGNVLTFGLGGGGASRASYAGTTNKAFSAGATVAAVLLAEDLADAYPVKIGEVVTTASQATVTFSSIPSGFRNLCLKYTARDTSAGTGLAFLTMRLNSDAGNNYTTELSDITANGAPTDNETILASAGNVGLVMQGGTAASRVCRGWIELPNYTDGFAKNWLYQAFGSIDNTTSKQRVDVGGGYWNNGTGAITQIDLTPGTGAAAGCVFTLYAEP